MERATSVRDESSALVRRLGTAAALVVAAVAAALALPLWAVSAEAARPTIERSSSAPDATLRIYFRSLGPFFVSFRAAYDRGDAAFRRSDPDDAALLATRLSSVSRDFSAAATGFRKVTAPASLRAAHLGMVTAIVLDARIFTIYADAWEGHAEDGDLQRAARRQAETGSLGDRAEILQRRWATTVSRAGKKESVPIPAAVAELAVNDE